MKNKLIYYCLFTLIIFLALFLRLYNLGNNPAGFFCDEASVGYNAYTILHTGKDEYGVSFPVFFQAFGEYKDPIEIYSTIPFIAILGLTEFAVRSTSALYGIFSVILFCFIGKQIRSYKFGLLCAGLAATMPWLLHYNRIGFELSPYVAFLLLSVLFLLKIEKNKKYIIPFFLTLSLTFYTYQSANPLLLPVILPGV
ncbi:MAG TPA: glycosyltransferase family 39 protein [Patescibacteria group bacterium]|nr:glycosyltransferase family 39 protein [Patescibacteria group bacterium]